MTAEQTNAIAQIRETYAAGIARLQRALSNNPKGYVHVWPKYWIGVKFNSDVCHGVGISDATVTYRSDMRTFKNGNGEQTILMSHREALVRALADANSNLEQFENSLVQAA